MHGEPGIYTARYADDELEANPELPKYQSVIKLLRKLEGEVNRTAYYRCAVTFMSDTGEYFQEIGQSKGKIATTIKGQLKKPFLYSVFVLDGTDKAFSDITEESILKNTYRYRALRGILSKAIKPQVSKKKEEER